MDPHRTSPRGVVRRVSVAPMMDRTDRHFRWLLRRITRHTLLYTEMVTANAVLHGDRERLLGYGPSEHPVALQLGGDEPRDLATCARIAEDLGYDEVNLNVGCPSSRVQSGNFGACLMRDPERVATCIEAMRAAVAIPVTVKHRIGVDELERYEDMLRFVQVVASAGADRFSVHARKAWLEGLSPKENRDIPPLRYGDVHRLKIERPELVVEINGGIKTLQQVEEQLEHVDAVMIGRAAWDEPWLFAQVDRRFFDPAAAVPTREDVIADLARYASEWIAGGAKPSWVLRGALNLFAGEPGTKAWKRILTEGMPRCSDPADLLARALGEVHRQQDRAARSDVA